MPIPIEFHTKFRPLLQQPHTFADIHGGRGGMKSTQVQLVALTLGIQQPMRICEARETMSSIKDSSHKMLSDLIYKHGMHVSQNGPYAILEDRIVRKEAGKTETEFIFVGVRENVRDQKSLAGINLTIFEEAAKASQDSLDVFVPTVIREPGSRIWFIWNPELTTDPTYDLLINKPPSNTIHIVTSYLENPWLSNEMRLLAEDCKRNTPKKWSHIWMGEPISEVSGAIFRDEMAKTEDDGRICSVPYDPTKPVHTAWDLGYDDDMFVWMVQARDGYLCFIDCLTSRQKPLSWYVIELQQKGYMYGDDWLPHDAVDSIIHHRLIGSGDKSMSIDILMRQAGRKVQISPKLLMEDTRNAARTIFPLCRFDRVKCAPGIEALRHYQWNKDISDDPRLEKPGKRQPLHNWASHGASGFMTATVSIKRRDYEEPLPPPRRFDRAQAEI
jgi:phage terminase large subunit